MYKLKLYQIESNMIYFDYKNIRISFSFGFFFIVAYVCSAESILATYSLLFCVMHELAHLCAMKKYGIRVNEISLYAAGIKISSYGISTLDAYKQVIIYSAGCLLNTALALIYLSIGSSELYLMNLCLAALNILPVSCLDGGRILCVLFPSHERMVKSVSILTVILITAASVFTAVYISDFSITSYLITSFVFILSLFLD